MDFRGYSGEDWKRVVNLMSGECDKCGEHCTDCRCNAKDQYSFQEKLFDSSEDMFKYVNEWGSLPLDRQTAERFLNAVKKDILMNVFLTGKPMNNAEFSKYCEKLFEFSMKNLHTESLK